MVGELNNFEEIICDPAKKYACPISIEEAEGKLLHVSKYIRPHICLHQRAVSMPDDSDIILKDRTENVGQKDNPHDSKESGI